MPQMRRILSRHQCNKIIPDLCWCNAEGGLKVKPVGYFILTMGLNYNIPFCAVVDHNRGKDDRLLSHMRTLGFENRAVSVGTGFLVLKEETWTAEEVQRNSAIAIQRNISFLYLDEASRGAVV